MKTEKRYLVKWEIDEFATSPLEAIMKAIKAMPTDSNPDTLATVFTVEEIDINSNEIVKRFEIDTLQDGLNPYEDDFDENKERDCTVFEKD